MCHLESPTAFPRANLSNHLLLHGMKKLYGMQISMGSKDSKESRGSMDSMKIHGCHGIHRQYGEGPVRAPSRQTPQQLLTSTGKNCYGADLFSGACMTNGGGVEVRLYTAAGMYGM